MVTKIGSQEVIKSLGGEAKLRTRFAEHREAIDFLQAHYAELREKYPNHWIMLRGSKLLATEDDPQRILEMLADPQLKHALIYYVADQEVSMILFLA